MRRRRRCSIAWSRACRQPGSCCWSTIGPEYQHGWGSKTYYTQLRLDPLPPASADEFLHALLGDDPSLTPLTQLLIARTEGNPFFLEESVRTLVETGVLVGAPGAYRLAQALPTMQVPATVQAVLAARIDRLPPEDKRLLQTAAVIGTDVPLPLLQAIAELPEDALHRGLAHLQAAEFLYETRLFPEREYTFKHALTHEVAYSTLLQERRRSCMPRLSRPSSARWRPLTEQVERLAYHALRGEVWDKAAALLPAGGEKAMTRSAYQRGGGLLRAGASRLHHLPESSDTGNRRSTCASISGMPCCRWETTKASSLSCVTPNGSQRPWTIVSVGTGLWHLSHYFCIMRHLDRAFAYGQRAVALAEPFDDIGLCAHAHFDLAGVHYSRGIIQAIIAFGQRGASPAFASGSASAGSVLRGHFPLPGPVLCGGGRVCGGHASGRRGYGSRRRSTTPRACKYLFGGWLSGPAPRGFPAGDRIPARAWYSVGSGICAKTCPKVALDLGHA